MGKAKPGLLMKHFVLSPTKNDPYGYASRRAAETYARIVAGVDPALAQELQAWMHEIECGLRADKEATDAD